MSDVLDRILKEFGLKPNINISTEDLMELSRNTSEGELLGFVLFSSEVMFRMLGQVLVNMQDRCAGCREKNAKETPPGEREYCEDCQKDAVLLTETRMFRERAANIINFSTAPGSRIHAERNMEKMAREFPVVNGVIKKREGGN